MSFYGENLNDPLPYTAHISKNTRGISVMILYLCAGVLLIACTVATRATRCLHAISQRAASNLPFSHDLLPNSAEKHGLGVCLKLGD